MTGQLGWPACDGNQVIGRHRRSRDHRISVQTSTQRHRGEVLLRNLSAQRVDTGWGSGMPVGQADLQGMCMLYM